MFTKRLVICSIPLPHRITIALIMDRPADPTDPTRELWIQKIASVIMQPRMVCMPFVLIGFALWLLPCPPGSAGFDIREPLTGGNFLLLGFWYALIFFGATLGQMAAGSLPKLHIQTDGVLNERTFYWLLSFISFVGVMLTWALVLRNGVSLGELIRTQQFNTVKDTLYDNYSHLYSLRFTASLAGGYAIYRLVFLRKFGILDLVNLGVLLAAASISARIMLIQAVVFSVGLAVRFDTLRNLKPSTIVLSGLAFSVLIVAFTWVRSAGTYRDEFGVTSPLTMTYLECKRYLGVPIQTSVGVATVALQQPPRGTPGALVKYTTPTFLHPKSMRTLDDSGGVGEQWYLHLVDIDETLTTNSAFAEMYGDLGFLSFPTIAWVSFFMALLGFYFWRSENLLCLIGCVVLYGFFELWRTYYFAAGSFTFLILAVLFAATAALYVRFGPQNDDEWFEAVYRDGPHPGMGEGLVSATPSDVVIPSRPK